MKNVSYTCPDIDAIIEKLIGACTNCETAVACIDDENYQGAKRELRDAIWVLEDFKGKYKNPLEDIRLDNTQLRDNWMECEERIKELEDQVNNQDETV